jgi:hypothetical protein
MILMKDHQMKIQAQSNNFKNSKFVKDLEKFIKASYINTFNYSLPINYLITKDFDFKDFTFSYQIVAKSDHFYINLK